MLRRLLAVLGLALAFVAAQASAQSLTTYTFATLPGSPTAGQLAWITDNSGTPTVGSPAAGGAGAGNRDLVSWDATQTRWEFVARQPTAGPAVPVSTLMDAVRIAYANGTSGATSADVQSAIDELFRSNKAVQPAPSVVSTSNSTFATITEPSATSYGWGVQFSSLDGFDGETYPGSGVGVGTNVGNETDNQACFFYNKTGCDGIVLDQYEYTFDDSFELAYRTIGSGQTLGHTWLEQNYDLSLPYLQSTVTGGAGFNPAVGSYITFSGGGTGKVRAWNSGTGLLDWVQEFGTTAPGQTVTGTGGSKTLGFVSKVSNSIRPFGWSFDTVTGNSGWAWLTNKLSPYTTFALADGRAGVNIVGQVYAGGFEAHGENPGHEPGNNYPAIWLEYKATSAANDGIWTGAWFDMNLTGGPSANGSGNTKTLYVRTPGLPPAYDVVWDHAGIVIADQRGIGRNTSSALRIDAQSSYGGSGTTIANVDFVGGNWNNGHIVLGGYGGSGSYTSGDHLWMDQTNNVLRLKAGASNVSNIPTSETDGRAFTMTVATGTRAMATSAISAGACNTADASITATGVLATDVVKFSPNADPGLNSGLLVYSAWAGSGVISFRVCNPSAGSITPAAVTLNWRVER